ncbi:hypothetical protein BP6252_05561 [Coleophoma cylindrospora]|uniref:Zn(2)-C6 fungal-type domain-containing protein n=1 Tax=Coleophoma cylindrospora TaxID=1849047 RepID=A0A3D8RU72_9HELO|nr:hypothetical protein BP6252_05561 [Coleophoma cylindrospora]
MYQPLRPRLKKTNIVRARTGCQTCKRRKLKCDEGKPECRACLNRGIECEGYAQRIAFRNDTNSTVQRVINLEKQKWTVIRAEQAQESTSKKSARKRKRSMDSSENDDKQNSDATESSTRSAATKHLMVDGSKSPTTARPYGHKQVISDSPAGSSKETSTAATQLLALSGSLKTRGLSYEKIDLASLDGGVYSHKSEASEYQTSDTTNTPSTTVARRDSYMDCGSSCGPSQTDVTLDYGSLYDEMSTPSTLTNSTERERWSYFPETNNNLELTQTEDSYILYWCTTLLPQLPPVFRRCESTWSKFKYFRNATLSLASADIAHANIGRRGASKKQALSISQHRLKSLDYYSEALENLSVASSTTHDLIEECAKLAVLLVFAFFEMESGTFAGSVVHVRQMDKLITENIHLYSTSADGKDLICACTALRAQLSCDCIPWRYDGFPYCMASNAIKLCIQEAMQYSATPYEHLIPLLAEICHLNELVSMGQTFGFDSSVSTYRAWVKSLDDFGYCSPGLQLSEEHSPSELRGRLKAATLMLDTWHDSLEVLELPFEGHTSLDTEKCDNVPGIRIKPLRFHSHESAMNYARYACAQLFCSQSNLDRCTSLSAPEPNEVSAWALLILRIVAGLDPLACVEQNTFKIGILWILSRITLLCASNEVVAWIEFWLQKAWQSGVSKEASIPLSIILKYVRKVRVLQDDGYRVLFMFCSITGKCERFSLYSEESSFRALVYGIDTKRGSVLSSSVIEI